MRFATMKYVAVAALSAVAAGAAQAADLAPAPEQHMLYSKAPIAESFSWTGFYIGGNVGWNWLNTTRTDTGPGVFGQVFPIGSQTNISRNGFLGGAQIGYNYQFGRYLVGLEGDFDWSAAKIQQSGTPFGGLTFSLRYRNNYVSTFGLRLGYTFDRLLVYGKAGGAWTQEDYDSTASDGSESFAKFNRLGWMLGVGAEYAIWNHLTVKAEYNYLDFGTKNQTMSFNAIDLVTGTITDDPMNTRLTAHVLKFGVNYLFN